jgi:cytochrome P450
MTRHERGLPAGPRFGAVHAWLFVNHPRRYSAWLRRRYGDVATLRLLNNTAVMVLTPEGARQVFAAPPDGYDAFHKEAFIGLTGRGSLWVIEGSRHQRERRLLSPPLNAKGVRAYGELIKAVALAHTGAWQSTRQIGVFDAMLDISRDVVMRIAFGVERGALFDEGRRALSGLLEALHPMFALDARFQAWWFPPWRRYERAKQVFATFVTRCLSERRAGNHDSDDVFGLLLKSSHDDGAPISDDEICDELITILVSGHETTAIALSWALYELVRHPEVLARLRSELDALGADPAPDVIAAQPYLSAVCNETLRLHTILTEIGRTTRVPCELLGYALPQDTNVTVSISAIHQDPSLYPEPDLFRPERFLNRTYRPFEFLPFGGGHRRCLGAHLSDYEMRIVLALIVTHWQIELAGPDRDVRHAIAMGPKHGVPVRVTRRASPQSTTTADARLVHAAGTA